MTTQTEATAVLNHEQLREKLRRLMLDEQVSQNSLAKRIGLSASALSQFLGNEYAGDNNKVADKIVRWFHHREPAEQVGSIMPVAPSWIQTPTAMKIYDALGFAQMAGDISVIYGGAGFGKTKTIRHYQSKNPNVWTVVATPATASVGVLLEEIANAIGLHGFPLHPAKINRRIIEKINDTGGLVAIDEAQHLTRQSLEQVRSIHDATGIGLALLGNASVYNALFRGGNNGFAQLFSRVGKRVPLVRPLAGDVAAIAAAFKVKGDKELQRLEEIARQPGALRMVVKTLRLATMAADGESLTRAHLDGAWRELQGDVPPEEAARA